MAESARAGRDDDRPIRVLLLNVQAANRMMPTVDGFEVLDLVERTMALLTYATSVLKYER